RFCFFFFSSRRRHTRSYGDWSSDVCSSDLIANTSPSVATAEHNASTCAFALCSAVATLGLVFAIGAVLVLPQNATLFGGMLVISPLNSLFKIICIVLAVFTMLMTPSEKSLRNHGEYLAIILLATT